MKGTTISNHLRQKELNFSILAQAMNSTTSHVYNVAYRNTVSRPIAEKIALALELPFYEVFPEYRKRELAAKARQTQIENLSKLVNS